MEEQIRYMAEMDEQIRYRMNRSGKVVNRPNKWVSGLGK